MAICFAHSAEALFPERCSPIISNDITTSAAGYPQLYFVDTNIFP
jgi:hypothetical protein